MSVIGPARSGKSSLLSFMYGKENTFRVSPLVKPETRGFWIAVKEYSFSGKKLGLLLIDSEGLYDTENGPEISKAIARFSFLLSNLVVFNSNKVYDQNDLQVLSEGCSFLVSKQEANFPEIKIVVRNCSLQDKPLMISKISSLPSRHKKTLQKFNKNNDQICTLLFPMPTVEAGNVVLAKSSQAFQKEFSEFSAQVLKTISEHASTGRLIASNDVVERIKTCVQEVNSLKIRSSDDLLDQHEMQLVVSDFNNSLRSISHLEFEAKAGEVLSQAINKLTGINQHSCSSAEVECRRFYEETRTPVIKKLEQEMREAMATVERATTSLEMKHQWQKFHTKYFSQSKFMDYELQYKNLLRTIELTEQKKLQEETRRKLEELRLSEEKKRREEMERAAELQRNYEENVRRTRELEEKQKEEAENQRRAREKKQKEAEIEKIERKLLKLVLSSKKSSKSSSPSKKTYHCSNCGKPGHNKRTCDK